MAGVVCVQCTSAMYAQVLGGSLNFERNINSSSLCISESKNRQFGFLKYFRIKELSIFGFLKKIQNQRIVSSNCFKNLKELMVFMKELSNNWHSLASSSKKKLRTIVIYPNQLFDNFEN
jgi:hypothetical protein